MKLEKLIQISDLRSVWSHEAKDFTPWLSNEDNLALLSDAIGFELELVERESSVGDFSVDILAKDVSTNRIVIIENQLEDTNHDHLGKLITYASGKDAEIIIWIVKRAREEHKQAIEWLNQHTDDKLNFFLVEIELWKIGNSLPAPKFNIVERPNDWAKAMRKSIATTEGDNLKLRFWEEFNANSANCIEFTKHFKTRKPMPQGWYDIALGSSNFYISLTVRPQKNTVNAALYFPDNRTLFDSLKPHAEKIASILGDNPEWKEIETQKARQILVSKSFDINDITAWQETHIWLCETSLKFRTVSKMFLDKSR